jgi:signal transduction histidine kinase
MPRRAFRLSLHYPSAMARVTMLRVDGMRATGSASALAGTLVPAVAVALALATLFVIPRSGLGSTTYGGGSVAAQFVTAAAGLSLVGVGLLLWAARPERRMVRVVAGLAACGWFASTWVGWMGAPPVVRSVAMVVEPVVVAAIVHLVLAGPDGRLHSRPTRAVVAVLWAATAVYTIGRAAVRDPFLDRYCWSNCEDNVFLISARPGLARRLDDGWIVVTVLVGLALATYALVRLGSSSAVARRALWPVLAPGALLGAALSAYGVALAVRRPEDPHDAVFSSLYLARAWAVVGLAGGLAWMLVRARRARAAVARLADDLGAAPAPGSLAAVLAQGTGDPDLTVVYPHNGGEGYIDAAGAIVELPKIAENRTATPIVRNEEQIAVVVHDSSIVDAEQLRTEIGAAARLAIENERLRAQVLAQLADLRASRGRVVEAGDAERRRLERNLHDGAQQRLLALSYEIRLAHAEARACGDSEVAAQLEAAETLAGEAITDLRDLAHGIYPAVLTESGLGAALWTLADTAHVPVEVDDVPVERFARSIERTVFVIAADAVDATARWGGDHVTLRVMHDGGAVTVEARGAGPGPFLHLADRVGAVGGRLHVDDGVLRAELPCG